MSTLFLIHSAGLWDYTYNKLKERRYHKSDFEVLPDMKAEAMASSLGDGPQKAFQLETASKQLAKGDTWH